MPGDYGERLQAGFLQLRDDYGRPPKKLSPTEMELGDRTSEEEDETLPYCLTLRSFEEVYGLLREE